MNPRIVLLMAATIILSACGGGGGGSGSDSAGVTITTDNVDDISQLLLVRSFFMDDYQQDVADLLSETTPLCTDGGSVTTTGSISNPPVVGDTITLIFSSCNADGEITNGEITMTIAEIPPNFDGTPPYTLRIDVVLTSLSVTDTSLGLTSVSDGDISILIMEDLDGNLTTGISGISLENDVADNSETLSNYEFVVTRNLVSNEFNAGMSGTLNSSFIGGSVSFDTSPSFSGDTDISVYPTEGVLLITTDADNSQARLSAQPNDLLLVEVDSDGDGIYEYTDVISWSTLDL